MKGRYDRHGSGHRIRVALVGMAMIALACSGSGGSKPPAAAILSTTSTTTPLVPTTTVDSTKAEILAAYRAAWEDIDLIEGHYPINVVDPRIEDHIAGDELNQVRSFMTVLKVQSQYLAGPPTDTHAAIVKQVVGTVAVVSDCNIDGSILMNWRTKQVIKPGSLDRTLVNAKLELLDGVWKMTEFSNVGVTCIVAS